MDFYRKSAFGLFDSSQKSFEIPVYQRAYSWEEEQWDAFLNDLLEQTEGDNNYFFGNILLETIRKDFLYEIIDGQQRITTLSIFVRALLNVLKERKLENFDFQIKENVFLKNGGNIKLRPVEYDRLCYDSIIIDNLNKFETSSPSQNRIISAKKYFIKELSKIPTDKILNVLAKLESTNITVIELEGKKDSALMFELENNRGKDLTNMERIKSYFMYQMYVYSKPNETETNIENISNVFKSIYLLINDLKTLNEDSVLLYHNIAYIKGYNYRTLDDLKEIFKKSEDKINYIKNYINELHTTFSNIKKFERINNVFAFKLKRLIIPAYIYPFIIKGYKYFSDDNSKLSKLFRILEIVTFRAKLINSRANIQERLNSILLKFDGDLDILNIDVRKKLNDEWYWGDTNIKNYLNGNMYGNNVINYLLWEYEGSIQNKGYKINNITLENEQIEHISPQTPTNGDMIASGYEVNDKNEYSDDFVSDYLNCLGNLMLISGSHNSSIGNKPFKNKLESYEKNPLLNQQAEIKNFGNNNCVWKKEEIDKRHNKILEFAIKRWSFLSIEI